MKKINNKFKGFTLVELLTVIAIIGIIAAIMIPAVNKLRERGNRIRNVEKSNPSFIELEKQTINNYTYAVVKHNETGILYVVNYNTFSPLFDKDGKPLVKY